VPISPILLHKDVAADSLFTPSALLREARRQKGLATADVPPICILDPDGDIVRRLRRNGSTQKFAPWPCYHTELEIFQLGAQTAGIIGCAVGAPFAVLVAEQLFACGCRLLISVTSAGQIVAAGPPPYFVLIERALRDEGTSYHYAAPAEFAAADPHLVQMAKAALERDELKALVGSAWTTDAPFRETRQAIEAARARGVMAVEMEAAALYAFAQARGAAVLCVAHVTNAMGRVEGDFEKGDADGTTAALALIGSIAAAWRAAQP
jgi:uridine phosphorylase